MKPYEYAGWFAVFYEAIVGLAEFSDQSPSSAFIPAAVISTVANLPSVGTLAQTVHAAPPITDLVTALALGLFLSGKVHGGIALLIVGGVIGVTSLMPDTSAS